MSLRPRDAVSKITPAIHGGINYAEFEELGVAAADVTDFSANLNPFGPPPGLREALNRVDITQYPDSESTGLRRALAQKLGLQPENILVGNGSTEIIYLAALAYFGAEDRVLLIKPSFGEYEVASRIAGASIIEQRLLPETGFQLPIKETVRLIRKSQLRGIFITNPHNPTGSYLQCADVASLLESAPDALLVLDEAYIAFVDNAWSSLDMLGRGNLLILRSMTKDFALAGLRLGYGVAHKDIIDTLRRVRPPWNVNVVAQEAGIIALQNEAYVKECEVKIREAKKYLIAGLSRLGLPPVPSEASFLLVKVGNAAEFRRRLLRHRILVRDCASFGLADYIRIATRTMPECRRLIKAVTEIRRG